MSDAAVKVDPEYYNTRLLEETGTNGEPRRAGEANFGRGSGGHGGGGMHGGNVGGLPDLPDYLVRQHSLLGFYLSLNPGDEGRLCVCICSSSPTERNERTHRVDYPQVLKSSLLL